MSSPQTLRLSTAWRGVLSAAGVIVVGLGCRALWNGLDGAAPAAFVAIGSAVLLLAAVGSMPKSIKFGDNELAWPEAEDRADQVSNDLSPSSLAAVAGDVIASGKALTRPTSAFDRRLLENAFMEATVLRIVAEAASSAGAVFRAEPSNLGRWDAEVICNTLRIVLETRRAVSRQDADRLAALIREMPEKPGLFLIITSEPMDDEAVEAAGSSGVTVRAMAWQETEDALRIQLVELFGGAGKRR